MNSHATTQSLNRLLQWYEQISPSSLALTPQFYHEQAYFKDPFHTLNSASEIQHLMQRMFDKLEAPRFIFLDRLVQDNQAFVTWDFHCRLRQREQRIHGSSHLRFNADGRVDYHRDYWDVAEEILAKLPLIGWPLRRLYRHVG